METSVNKNNKRIAKNTIMLYIRMLAITLISLYTVRITLQILGADDYGIYNAVAGVIGFIGFISATLTNVAQRYLAYDLGKSDGENYSHTFSMMFTVFMAIALIIAIIAEILGPWLIRDYLVIPNSRQDAAQLVFQISLISLVLRFATIPYMASIVANEKMVFYAYLSIVEVVLKLLIVYALYIAPGDKLIFYAFLLLLMDGIISLIYVWECLKKLPNCRLRWYWNRKRFKEIGGFIGWNTLGSLSGSLQTQAVTMVTSVFFAPSILASRAIADRVNNVSYSFVTNFILASSPQMVKYYAAGDKENFNLLFYRVSKFGYYLMILIAFPLIVLMPELLKIWLSENLLAEMVLFSRLTLINALVSSLEIPISRAVAATGKVKMYQILNCTIAFAGIPLIVMVFKAGMGAEWGYIVCILILLISLSYRLWVLRKYTTIKIRKYISEVALPALIVTFVSSVFAISISYISIENIVYKMIFVGFLSFVGILIILYSNLKKSERKYFNQIVISRFHANRE